jgi:hypothetical protein
MEILGLRADAIIAIVLVVVWFVLMRVVLPRLGIST